MQPDYSIHDPKGYCGDPRRGAALGRGHFLDEPDDYDGPLYIRRIYLNSQGYDRLGTYFGRGDPLYWVCSPSCSVDYVARAKTRAAVRIQVVSRWPLAKVRS
jgi:hypothetical protein